MPEVTAQLTTALGDRYRIERELGAGGMATVYLAHDVRHNRKVALKVLRPELAAVIGADRFLKEIEVTANLQHPHILPLHDSGDAGGFLFYVMPYVEGESLRDRLKHEKQLAIDDAVELTRAVASALDYAHRHGVIHRDIKPENVLLHEGQALIADFGIALAVSHAGGTRLTETGLSVGTPHYMSPEQAMGDRELDARSDVYSLGAMLYEMLAGDPPYTGSTAQAIVAKVITEKPPMITVARDTVPASVAAAIHKSLAKLPADRFQTAAQFAEALANPAFTLGTARTPDLSGQVRSPRGLLVAYAWPAAAALAMVVALWGWLRPNAAPPSQTIRYGMLLPEGEGLVPVYGPRIAIAPDGSKLAYIGPGEAGGRIWIRERNQLSARPLPGTEGAFVPFFSPDGQSVGFLSENPPSVKVASLGGGPPVTLADSAIGFDGASWGQDGYIYVDLAGGGGLGRVLATGGTLEAVSTLDSAAAESSHNWPVALPGGKGVLFSAWHGSGPAVQEHDIAVLDLTSGQHRVLVRGVAARYASSGHLAYVTAGGALMAAPFDEDRLELTGPATALIEGVAVRLAGSIDVAISATGTLAYVTGGVTEEPFEPVWVDRDGTAEPIDPGWVGNFATLALSPDGSKLAIGVIGNAGRDLWIKQLDRGPLTRLTFPDGNDHRPWWTYDGQSVLFISDRGENRDLYRKRADGVGQAELVLDLPDPVNQAMLSPDGEWLVYRTGRNDKLDIYARRLRGDTATVPLFADPSINEHTPALSPDGKWLAYISDESGQWELYVRPFPNVNDGRWQISTAGGAEPRWAHSGREIFFKDRAGDLVSVAIQTAPSFSAGQQRKLFSVSDMYSYDFQPQYDVAPDDKRFVMIRVRGTGATGSLVMVDNWFPELNARVAR